ncbi:MAG: hypothetical protein AAF682_07295 [Planctomycetota bacterium]
MPSSSSLLFPALVLLLFGAFLFLLLGLARAAGRATQVPEGGQRGCLGGCGLVAVLVFLCATAIAAFVALIALALGVAAVEHNPVESVEIRRFGESPTSWSEVSSDLVCLTFEFDGDAGWLVDLVGDLFEVEEADLHFIRRTEPGLFGEERTMVDVYLPLDIDELDSLEGEIRRELPRLSARVSPGYPEAVRVEFRAASRAR